MPPKKKKSELPVEKTTFEQALTAQLTKYQTMIDSGFLPKHINTPQKALAVAELGKEMGFKPFTSWQNIFPTGDGKIGVNGRVIMNMLRRAGLTWNIIDDYVEDDDNEGMIQGFVNRRTVVEMWRLDQPEIKITGKFTKKDACRIPADSSGKKLIDKFNYKYHMKKMFFWRALKDAADKIAGGDILGVYLPDEVGFLMDGEGSYTTEETLTRPVPSLPERNLNMEVDAFQQAVPIKPDAPVESPGDVVNIE